MTNEVIWSHLLYLNYISQLVFLALIFITDYPVCSGFWPFVRRETLVSRKRIELSAHGPSLTGPHPLFRCPPPPPPPSHIFRFTSFSPSVCRSACLPASLSVSFSSRSSPLCVSLSYSLSVCASVCLSLCPSVRLSVCVCLSVSLCPHSQCLCQFICVRLFL